MTRSVGLRSLIIKDTSLRDECKWNKKGAIILPLQVAIINYLKMYLGNYQISAKKERSAELFL